jgi:hypothetical protein
VRSRCRESNHSVVIRPRHDATRFQLENVCGIAAHRDLQLELRFMLLLVTSRSSCIPPLINRLVLPRKPAAIVIYAGDNRPVTIQS